MKDSRITWLIALFVIIALAYTGYSYVQKDDVEKDDVEKEKYKNYISAKAVIDQKLPERVTRYGAKKARYAITITDARGEKIIRYNCELNGSLKEKDSITVYYDPNDPNGGEVITKIP